MQNNYSWIPSTIDGSAVSLQRSDEWSTAEIELSLCEGEILHAFNISTEGPVNIRNAYYYCDCEELDIHPVELALATTTFKKKKTILSVTYLFYKRTLLILMKRLLIISTYTLLIMAVR